MRKKSIAISFIQRQTREERDDSLGAGKPESGRVGQGQSCPCLATRPGRRGADLPGYL